MLLGLVPGVTDTPDGSSLPRWCFSNSETLGEKERRRPAGRRNAYVFSPIPEFKDPSQCVKLSLTDAKISEVTRNSHQFSSKCRTNSAF